MTKRHKRLVLGPLPVNLINKLWELELDAGNVICSTRVAEKIEDKHADDYELFMSHHAECLTDPAYIGINPRHQESVELIRRIPSEGQTLLLSVTLKRGKQGDYMLTSAYTIREEQVAKRREAMTLLVVI